MLNFRISNKYLRKVNMRLTDQTLSSLTAALTHASRAYRAAADKVASDFGLSQATGLPVLVISRFGENGVRPGVLAETLSLEASSLVRVVDHLIESAWWRGMKIRKTAAPRSCA
jgi:MarR family transcriptional regulator for hemolysin